MPDRLRLLPVLAELQRLRGGARAEIRAQAEHLVDVLWATRRTDRQQRNAVQWICEELSAPAPIRARQPKGERHG